MTRSQPNPPPADWVFSMLCNAINFKFAKNWRIPRAILPMQVLLALVFACSAVARGDDKASCHVIPVHEPSPAEKANLEGKASDAEAIYRVALSKSPHDAVLTAALVRTLLREQKVDDASSTIAAELTSAPNSVPLLTASAEVAYRQGKIAEAATIADQAFKIDPCNPRLYLLRARILRLNSMYASERRAINFAHALDPSDIDIRGIWLGTLPLTQRIDAQKQFLASANGMNPEERERAEKGLSNLVSQASNSDKTCHLVSTAPSTDLPLVPVMSGGNSRYIESWGLHVFFNNNAATLAVDTGASGLLINRAIADRAGLKSAGRAQIGGVGDQGPSGGYVAYADSIRVGSLEFRDCMVEVTDRKDILGMDGLIGTDVFSSYLVTLDYPMRKFLLSPLPPRPTDIGSAVVALNTNGREPTASMGPGSAAQSTGPEDRYVSPTMKDYSPVFRSGHFLIVPTLLNGKAQGLFMVDTGAFSTSISPGMARAVTKVHGGPGSIRGLSGDVTKVMFSEAILFQFAGIQQQNNDLVSFDALGLSRGAGFEISGFLGSTVLRQLTISIDYRDGLIKFDYDPRHGNHNF
jgi:predicted aspartyl protease/Flp pilus assembly protein TadD